MFLVDTNIISELAPSRRHSAGQLVDWLDRASPFLFMSVISAAEIGAGIFRAEREGATAKAKRLFEWWQAIEYLYSGRLLPFDLSCAHEAGKLVDRARAHAPGFEDVAIAATAAVHGLTVLTRNRRHFVPLGVRAQDPFIALPEIL